MSSFCSLNHYLNQPGVDWFIPASQSKVQRHIVRHPAELKPLGVRHTQLDT